jgi:glycerate 2-kinase
MIKIKNRKELIENGETAHIRECRKTAVDCIEYTINAVEPKQLLERNVKVEHGCLQIDGCSFELSKFKHIYVIGGGKASGRMALAIEDIMGSYLTAGIVNIPYGTTQKTSIIKLNQASHPIPDEASVKGTLRMMEIAEQAQKNDLIISVISGGGSSLMSLPTEAVTLSDKKAVTDLLLKSGASITEINIVRKHLSAFKGGWLAKKAFPATVLNLILSDVIGDPLDAIASGPTVPDPSTFKQAKAVIEKYKLSSRIPESAQTVLSKGERGLLKETPKPKDPAFSKVYNKIIGNNKTATLAAVDCLNSKGLNTLLMAKKIVGEARIVGGSIANFTNCAFDLECVPKPLGVILGGEATVTVRGKGLGGRNMELALSAALNLKADKECVVASFGTDGIDGPTDAAGAIVDNYTLKRAKELGVNALSFLDSNDSYTFFSGLKDLVFTRATGTNVNDVSIVVC